jgi:hypothetical protein
MNKEQTKEAIAKLPYFFKKEVQVDGIHQKRWIAIVEEGETEAINIPTPRYNLVQLHPPFNAAIEDLEEFDADLMYHHGIALLNVFPKGDEYKDDKFQYGFSVINSVTSETGIGVRFSIGYHGKVLRLPVRVGKFTKTHSNKEALKITTEYLGFLTKIREAWGIIVEEFPKIIIKEEEIPSYAESFNLCDDTVEKVKRIPNCNLWTLVMLKFTDIHRGRNKSEIHEAEKYDDLMKQIWAHAMSMKLVGGAL